MNKKALSFLFFAIASISVQAQMIDSGVIVHDLPTFSLDGLGTKNSFSSDIWQNSDEQTLLELIKNIGEKPVSPASKQTLIHLLTQDSTGYKKENSTNTENLFLTARLNALVRLGAFEETLNLIKQIPEKQISEEILQIKFYTLLLLGKIQEAEICLENITNQQFLDKARINLFLEKEEKNKAILSYEIYKETYPNSSDLFSTSAENVLLELEQELFNSKATAEDVFLLARIKNKSIDLKSQDLGIQKILTQLPYTSIENRVSLAENIGLSSDELSKIYALPLHDIKIENNTLKRADLFQKLQNETMETRKIKLLNEIINLAVQDKILLSISPLIKNYLDQILPQPAHLSIAFNASQIYALDGNLEKANEWYQLLKNSPLDSHQKQRLLLIPFLHNLGAGIPSDLNSLILHFCTKNIDEKCADFYQRLSSEAYDEINMPVPTKKTLPFDYMKEENKSKTGENLLRAIADLNNPEIPDKTPIYTFIFETTPKKIELQFQRERLFYQ